MKTEIVPRHYADWRHCIEVDCGLWLDSAFIQLRLVALQNSDDPHTQQFVRRWGESHRQRVIAWFRQAHDELDTEP